MLRTRSERCPAWPAAIPRNEFPIARFNHAIDALQFMNRLAVQVARDLAAAGPRNSFTTGTAAELMFVNGADFTAVASTAAEASLLTGVNEQPTLPGEFFFNKTGLRRSIVLTAQGVFSNTGTPTLIFQARLSPTQGSSTLSGASIGVSPTITTTSGVTNVWWSLRLELVCTVAGQGSGNATLAGAGYVISPAGFASPFIYALEPTTPNTATWTQTFNADVNAYVNLSVTWSANSASNTITAKQVKLYGEN